MIEIKGIKKSYRKAPVLTGVSFSCQKGTCTGIVGKNGSGKSTLIEILAGVIKADSGVFLIDGSLAWAKNVRSKTGYVPQSDPLMPELTALDNMLLWNDRTDIERELSEDGLISMLGVSDFLKKRVSMLSGGMKKRLSIAVSLVSHPEVLLLDEPTASLDLSAKDGIYLFFKKYCDRGGTIILVTHDAAEIELCDRTFLLKDGQVSPFTYDGDIHALVERL